MDAASLEQHVNAMADMNNPNRFQAIRALGLTEPDPEDAVSKIIDGMAALPAESRRNAVLVLFEMGTLCKAARRGLKDALADPDMEVKYHAARSLRLLGPEAP